MKVFLVIASLVLAISASTDEELWIKFKQDHGKTYKSLREEKLRFDIFKSNVKTINEHNAKYENGEETWTMGINKFADLTDEEFRTLYLTHKQPEIGFTGVYSSPMNFTAPDSIDWREKGAVLSVKNQGRCGSCWAFSAVAALEAQNALKKNIREDLSEQELVDCSKKNYGCSGGLMNLAFEYIQEFGLSKLSDYPYKAVDQKCQSQKNTAGIKITGYKEIQKTESHLKEAIASVGPVAVGIHADNIRFYKSGVFNDFFCGYKINHGVLAVGYGTEGVLDYWIVKNSWGEEWGDHGYIKMVRNRFNQCGIASQASYPILA